MRLPKPETVELIDSLRMSVNIMTRIDGDRDHMNTSRLTCGQVQGAARLMLIAANKLEASVITSEASNITGADHGEA